MVEVGVGHRHFSGEWSSVLFISLLNAMSTKVRTPPVFHARASSADFHDQPVANEEVNPLTFLLPSLGVHRISDDGRIPSHAFVKFNGRIFDERPLACLVEGHRRDSVRGFNHLSPYLPCCGSSNELGNGGVGMLHDSVFWCTKAVNTLWGECLCGVV